MSSSGEDMNIPTTQKDDKACAILAREALFPLKLDWNKGQHVSIHPALDVLEQLRKNLVAVRDTPFSNLFPRHVMLVPVPGTAGREMQWNGQPDVNEDNTIEVVPNVLTVRCKQCPIEDVKAGVKAYLSNSSNSYSNTLELNVCSNAVLQKDYEKFARRENAETLLEQRRDLPTRSLQTIEETLAHELAKLQVNTDVDDFERPLLQQIPRPQGKDGGFLELDDCQPYAQLELLASHAAECMYEKRGTEVRKGSNLRPSVGFSLLPTRTQQDYISRCAQEVTIHNLSRLYREKEAKQCVKDAVAASGNT
eukprot:CAMPEP_0113462184 /NCGR_PEP_ID=MMETSP0014_2-20120614/11946_1 /TAXON_ID=2857 /ORGANISM="Nitzschia sp." /LENGTH=307 /DNA_ID=CAMNT_0000354009 /DNA_START=36 /DNA_END=959 /DNA_ORIENTATION=+ /assembly_acc=CAM_ASM_000159